MKDDVNPSEKPDFLVGKLANIYWNIAYTVESAIVHNYN